VVDSGVNSRDATPRRVFWMLYGPRPHWFQSWVIASLTVKFTASFSTVGFPTVPW
jgi:hypothetical protein